MRRTPGHSLAQHAGDRRVFWLGRSYCTARAGSSFLPLLQEVSSIYKTRNQLMRSVGDSFCLELCRDRLSLRCCVSWMTAPTATSPWSIPRLVMMMAKDGEVAHAFQPLLQVSRLFFWRLMQAQ